MTHQTQDFKSTVKSQSSESHAGTGITFLGHGLIIILCALIAFFAWSFTDLNTRINQNINENVTKVVNQQLKNPEAPLGELYECVKAIEPKVSFGEWKIITPNEIFMAESDGFLSVFSSGKGAKAKFTLNTSETKELTEKLTPEESSSATRSRAGRFEGATIPVKKGHFYKVYVFEGETKDVEAHWLPIVHESPHYDVCSKITDN